VSWRYSFQLFAPLRAVVLGQPLIQAEVSMPNRDSLRVGAESKGEISIKNLTEVPVKIIGVKRSCSCVHLKTEPTFRTIPSKGSLTIPFAVIPNKVGWVPQRVVLYTDYPKQMCVLVDVLGFSMEKIDVKESD
jgi:hypothetical protein